MKERGKEIKVVRNKGATEKVRMQSYANCLSVCPPLWKI